MVGERSSGTGSAPTGDGFGWATAYYAGNSVIRCTYMGDSLNLGPACAYCFRSMHEGGVFFAFADSQVRFLSENIDASVLYALGTKAYNEIIDDEDF